MYKNYLYQHWGDWLSKNNWDWWISLSFDDFVSTRKAKAVLGKWLKEIENNEEEIDYVVMVEIRKCEEIKKPFFYILLSGVKEEYTNMLREKWINNDSDITGIVEMEKYNPDLGVNYYILKYVKTYFSCAKFSENAKPMIVLKNLLNSALELMVDGSSSHHDDEKDEIPELVAV